MKNTLKTKLTNVHPFARTLFKWEHSSDKILTPFRVICRHHDTLMCSSLSHPWLEKKMQQFK